MKPKTLQEIIDSILPDKMVPSFVKQILLLDIKQYCEDKCMEQIELSANNLYDYMNGKESDDVDNEFHNLYKDKLGLSKPIIE